MLSGGTYSSIEVPQVVDTEASGINDAGVIVGYYYPNEPNLTEGFVLSGGVYTTIAIPGETYTVLYDINDNGVLLGNYQDATGLEVGFLAPPKMGVVCRKRARTSSGVILTAVEPRHILGAGHRH